MWRTRPYERHDTCRSFLHDIGRSDLATLIRHCTYEYVAEDVWGHCRAQTFRRSSAPYTHSVLGDN